MSVNSYLGKALTNRYAGSTVAGVAVNPTINDSYFANGEDKVAMDLVSTVAADSIGSTYKLLTVPSNARIGSLFMANDAIGTGATCSVGVYYPQFLAANIPLSGTVISATFFASGYSIAAASGWVDIINQSGNNTLPKQQMNLWQALGLSADPICELDIVITLSGAAATNAGNLALKAEFAI